MASRGDKLNEALDSVRALRDGDPTSADGQAALTAALAHKSHLVVAAAAAVAAEFSLDALAPALSAAFERLIGYRGRSGQLEPARADAQCRAKIAIARALYDLDCEGGEVYRAGVRHIQLEPVWGGREDTAAELRAVCAVALAGGHYRDALIDVAELLADTHVIARLGAAQALGVSGQVDVAVPLLRYKLLIGDDDVRVLGAACGSLLTLDPERELGHLSELLNADAALVREAAALALGESRIEGALEPLVGFTERAAQAAERRVGLVALAMLRTDGAWEHLLGLVARAPVPIAIAAVEALSAYRYQMGLGERVREAARGRRDRKLRAAVAEFDTDHADG